MKIAHVSDIHIRNLKFHADYRRVFADFYEKLERYGVDMVVNTGDTAHTKTNISPEFVSMTSEFFSEVSKRCFMLNVLGNHDLNLMNADREDAITPVVEALNNPNIWLLTKSGLFVPPFDGFKFWNLGIADVGNWPRPPYPLDSINIGLFHGSIRNCVTDSNFRMTHVEFDTDIFEGLDFALMGDIHKRQSFNDGRVWYAGSMIQQNFGEDPDKGFLLWDIRSKKDWKVEFVELHGNRKFYTVPLELDLKIPEMNIAPDSRVRIKPPRSLTLVEQRTVEKLVRKRWNPHDVITLGAQNIGQMTVHTLFGDQKIENLRDVSVQENLLRRFLADRNLKDEVINKILDLNRKYQVAIEQKDDMARGVAWRILKMGWNNLYNYGEGNVIDFSQVKGLTGIFAPNASGKSGMIDVITVGMFDANTKEVMKNIHLVNDNKDKAVLILELLANKERYTITREIERVKYNVKKDAKEWGKTTLDFVRHDPDGGIEKLVMESRPDTERQIRRRFGTFDDFMLTSLFAQWDPMDIIMCKETDRKRILFRFLDLDIFEDKAKLAKDESKVWLDRLFDLEDSNYEEASKNIQTEIEAVQGALEKDQAFILDYENRFRTIQAEIERLLEEKSAALQLPWKLHAETQARANAHAKIERLEQEIDVTSSLAHELVPQAQAIEEQLKSEDVEDLNACQRKVDELTEELALANQRLREHEIHVQQREKQLGTLGKVPCGDLFPTCQFLVDAFEAKRTIDSHRLEVLEAQVEVNQIEDELGRWETKAARAEERVKNRAKAESVWRSIDQYGLQVSTKKAQLVSAQQARATAEEHLAAIEQAAADVLRNEELDRQTGNARLNLSEVERIIKEWRVRVAKHHETLGSHQGIRDRIEKALATLKEVRDTCSAFEHFNDAMGKDGIALQVLTQKLPLINEEINKILGGAAEFGAFVDYDKDDQTIRLYLQYGQYKSRLLELGSGAEKFLASVAIRAALLSISNLPRSNMFIIDEGFGKLDPQNLESVQRMFDYLRSVFDHVIVISHSDLMKDMVDNMIEITTDEEGYAHVEVGG